MQRYWFGIINVSGFEVEAVGWFRGGFAGRGIVGDIARGGSGVINQGVKATTIATGTPGS